MIPPQYVPKLYGLGGRRAAYSNNMEPIKSGKPEVMLELRRSEVRRQNII